MNDERDLTDDELGVRVRSGLRRMTGEFANPDGDLTLKIPRRDRRGVSLGELTDKEHAVLVAMAEGFTNHEIAEILVLGDETIKTHVQHIYSKLSANGRVHAVAVGLREGVIT